MIAISQSISALVFTLSVFFCFSRVSQRGCITLLEWAVLGVGLIYGAGWFFVIEFTVNGYNPFWAGKLLPLQRYFAIHGIAVLILLGCIVIGYRMSRLLYTAGSRLSTGYFLIGSKGLEFYAWMFFIFAFFLRWLYVQAFGGFFGYLDYSVSIRSGFLEVDNRWSFLQPFSGVGFFSTFLFFASIIEGGKKFSRWVGFIASLLFSLYLLYSMLGRMDFLIFIAILILAVLRAKNVRPSLIVGGGVLGAFATIVLAFLVSDLMQVKSAGSMQEYLARELSFPFVSFFAQINSGEYLFRWFRDFFFAPLYLLPSSLWMHWVDNVSQVNTLVVLGGIKGDAGITGGIPVDLLTLGLMQCSIIGVIGVGLLFGALLSFLQGFVEGVQSVGLQAILWAYFSIRVAVFAVAYAHPVHLLSGVFGVLFSIFFLVILSVLKKVRFSR